MRGRAKWYRILPGLTALCVAIPAALGAEQGTNNNCVNNGQGSFPVPGGKTIQVILGPSGEGGQVSGAGATLFVDFFRQFASTNDFVDVDMDGLQGNLAVPPFADRLAEPYLGGGAAALFQTYWAFQYRSVGSVNGFNEFVQNQDCGTIPTSIPSEFGLFNFFQYAAGGTVTAGWGNQDNASGTPLEPCEIEFAFLDVPSVWATQVAGTPTWNANPQGAGYGLNPIRSNTGYLSHLQTLARACTPGTCSVTIAQSCSFNEDCPVGETCVGASNFMSLNQNFGTPDADTIYDYVGAGVPVSYIANRGTGLQDIKYSELQHLFVTGRMPSGENYVVGTRSVGSGTRNAIMNSTDIDTSWGRGDNTNNEETVNANFQAGPYTQASNAQGSGNVELAVQNRRLCVAYTGLASAGRAADDQRNGLYEILNLCKDVDENGNPVCNCTAQACAPRMGCSDTGVTCVTAATCNPGATCIVADADNNNNGYVRPSVRTVLDNCNACCGYQILGNGSFVTRGNHDANRDPLDPDFNATDPMVDNQAVADYLRNIEDSTLSFASTPGSNFVCTSDLAFACPTPGVNTASCLRCSDGSGPCTPAGAVCNVTGTCIQGSCVDERNMPGQYLATTFFLPSALDCSQSFFDGGDFGNPTSPLNQALQTFARTNNGLGIALPGGDPMAYGAINPAGRFPTRNTPGGGYLYSDGRTGGNGFVYWNNLTSQFVQSSGNNLAARNALTGNFDGVGGRDVNDFDELVTAYYTPRVYQQLALATGAGPNGNQQTDNAIPEIMADFDGNGSLTKEDLRYAADGLAMVGGALDRKTGAIAIDTAIQNAGQLFPWADTRRDLVIPPTAPILPSATYPEPTFLTAKNVNAVGDEFNATGTPYKLGDFRCDVAGGHLQQCLPNPAGTGGGRRCEVTRGTVTCNPTLCTDLVTVCNIANGDADCTVVNPALRCRYGAPECPNTVPAPGAQPLGWDGKCDALDIDYVLRNQGNWNVLDEAALIDASADMDGDLTAVNRIDTADVEEIVTAILLTQMGDLNLDGVRDQADSDTFAGNVNNPGGGCNATQSCGWADGDCNGDDVVDLNDLSACFPDLFPNGLPLPALPVLRCSTSGALCTGPAGTVGLPGCPATETCDVQASKGNGDSCRKNRYLSFQPNNAGNANVAFRVDKSAVPAGIYYPGGSPAGMCWVQAPNSVAAPFWPSAVSVSQCGTTAVFRDWTEGVIHLGDCEIIPVANYTIFTVTNPGEIVIPGGLAISTIAGPSSNSKLWGDTSGPFNGQFWPCPDGFTNVSDLLALTKYQEGPGNATRAHATRVNVTASNAGDSCLPSQVNTGDVSSMVAAIQTKTFSSPDFPTRPNSIAGCTAACPTP